MKILVMDVLEDKVVGMNKDGDFVEFKRVADYEVGSEVEIAREMIIDNDIENHKNVSSGYSVFSKVHMKKITSIAAAVVLLLGISGGAFSHYFPYSYVDIDINPSIEITANVFDRIIGVQGLNDDGRKIIDGLKIDSGTVEDGISVIIDKVVSAGYLQESEKSKMVVSVSSRNMSKAEELQNLYRNVITKDLSKKKLVTSIEVEKFDMAKHKLAKVQGMTPGKMLLIERLTQKEPSVNVDVYKNAPVHVILNRIKQIRKATEDESKKGLKKPETNNKKVEKKPNPEANNKKNEKKPKPEANNKKDEKKSIIERFDMKDSNAGKNELKNTEIKQQNVNKQRNDNKQINKNKSINEKDGENGTRVEERRNKK